MKRKTAKYNDYKTEVQWAKEGYIRFPASEGIELQANSHRTTVIYFSPEEVYFVGKNSDAAKMILEGLREKNAAKRMAQVKKNKEIALDKTMEEAENARTSVFEKKDDALYLDDKKKNLTGPCGFNYSDEEERMLYLLDGVDERTPCSRAIYETMSFEEREELEVFGGDEDIPWYDEEYYERMWREKTYSIEANYHWYEEKIIARHH